MTHDYGTWEELREGDEEEAAPTHLFSYVSQNWGTLLCLMSPFAVGVRYFDVPFAEAICLVTASLSLFGLIRLMHTCSQEMEKALSSWLGNIAKHVNSAAPILIASLVAGDPHAAQRLVFGCITTQLLLIFSFSIMAFSCGRNTAKCEPRPLNGVAASMLMIGVALLATPSLVQQTHGSPDVAGLTAVLLLLIFVVSLFSLNNNSSLGERSRLHIPLFLWLCAGGVVYFVIRSAVVVLVPTTVAESGFYSIMLPLLLTFPSVSLHPQLDLHVSTLLLSCMAYILLLAPVVHFITPILPLPPPMYQLLIVTTIIVKLFVSCNHVTAIEGVMGVCLYLAATAAVLA